MNDFVTVFEISESIDKDNLVGVIVSFVALTAGVGCLILHKKGYGGWFKRADRPILLILFGTISLFLSLIFFIGDGTQKSSLLTIHKNGQSEVTEGIVEVLYKQNYHGHDKGDRVRIGGNEFVIDKFVASPGYCETISHGGVLREGTYAKVYYYKGIIIRIEIAKPNKN